MSNPNKNAVDLVNLIKDKFTMRKDIAPVETSSTASRDYKVGDKFYYGNLLQRATQNIAQGTGLAGGVNFENADPVVTTIQNLSNQVKNNLNNNGSKNILINNAYSQTFLNVPVTVYDNKSMNFNGTSGNTANGLTITDEFLLKAGTYVLSQGNRTSVPPLYLQEGDTVLQDAVIDTSTSSYVVFTTSEDKIVTARFWIGKNLTYNGTVYPMLCLKTDWDLDNSYAEPAMTNNQLTTNKVSWEDEAQVGAVNELLRRTSGNTVTSNNVYGSYNSDCTITLHGTASASLITSIDEYKTYKAGTYKLSGAPSMGSSDELVELTLRTSSNVSYGGADNDTDGVIFTLPTDTALKLVIYVKGGTNVEGKVVKPMLTPASYNGPYVPPAKTNKELTEDVTTETVSDNVTSTVGTLSSKTAFKVGNIINVQCQLSLTTDVAAWGKILTVDVGGTCAPGLYRVFAAYNYSDSAFIPLQYGYDSNGNIKVETIKALLNGKQIRLGFTAVLV